MPIQKMFVASFLLSPNFEAYVPKIVAIVLNATDLSLSDSMAYGTELRFV